MPIVKDALTLPEILWRDDDGDAQVHVNHATVRCPGKASRGRVRLSSSHLRAPTSAMTHPAAASPPSRRALKPVRTPRLAAASPLVPRIVPAASGRTKHEARERRSAEFVRPIARARARPLGRSQGRILRWPPAAFLFALRAGGDDELSHALVTEDVEAQPVRRKENFAQNLGKYFWGRDGWVADGRGQPHPRFAAPIQDGLVAARRRNLRPVAVDHG